MRIPLGRKEEVLVSDPAAVKTILAQQNDAKAIISVINFLGLFIILGLLGILGLVAYKLHLGGTTTTGDSLLTALFTLIGSAVGAMGSMLANTHTSNNSPSPTSTATPVVAPVSISPPQVALAQGATQPFKASVANSPNAVVIWSVKAGGVGGSIDKDTGIYTAPRVTGNDIVVATVLQDPSLSGQAQVKVG